MPELDLIPDDYRRRQQQNRWLQKLAVSTAGMLLAGLAGYSALGVATERVEAQVADLQMRHAITTQQRTQLEDLEAQIVDMRRQWGLLQGLRAGAAAESMFVTIDRALASGEVWFLSWEFQRAGVVVNDQPRSVSTGYFIVMPAGDGPAQADGWQVETHMTINGQARDHEALSRFVRGLFAQPEVQDVRLRRTALRRYAGGNVVDFDLAVILESGVGRTG